MTTHSSLTKSNANMSVIKFKFFEALSTVMPVYDVALTVGDKITDVFAKLQGLLTWRNLREVVDTTATGAVNTTADYNMLTLSIPADTLRVGDIIEIDIFSLVKKGTGAMNSLYWLKVNGTKSTNMTYSLGFAAFDSVGFAFRAKLQVRSISGSSATLAYLAETVRNANSPLVVGSNVVPTFTVPSNTAITITAGANFSVANAANSIRPCAGGIKLW